MNGLLDPEYWRAVNERLVGLLGPQMERLNEVGGLLSGTLTPQEFMGKRAEQVKQSMTPDEFMNNFAGTGLLGKIVYHGSPHKFDKFDASKIGTGEGAQAYGHGVYLADSERVAQEYKNKLGMVVSSVDGVPTKTPHEEFAVSALKNFPDPAKAKAYFQNLVDVGLLNGKDAAGIRNYVAGVNEAIDRFSGKKVGSSIQGSLYKADLPDEWIPKMLDWDKPLSEQPEAVRKAISKTGMDESVFPHYTGEQFYQGEMNARGPYKPSGWAAPEASVGVSETLRQLGIPGIRYLDGGSRPNAGRISMLEQTIANLRNKGSSQAAIANAQRELDAELARSSYNYVVFPGLEDQVKILERNGVPLLE